MEYLKDSFTVRAAGRDPERCYRHDDRPWLDARGRCVFCGTFLAKIDENGNTLDSECKGP